MNIEYLACFSTYMQMFCIENQRQFALPTWVKLISITTHFQYVCVPSSKETMQTQRSINNMRHTVTSKQTSPAVPSMSVLFQQVSSSKNTSIYWQPHHSVPTYPTNLTVPSPPLIAISLTVITLINTICWLW